MKNKLNQQVILGMLLVVWGFIFIQTIGPTDESSRVPLVNVTGPESIHAKKQGNLHSNPQGHLKELSQNIRKREGSFAVPINIFDLFRAENNTLNPLEQSQSRGEEPVAFQGEELEGDQGNDPTHFRFLGYIQLDHSTLDEEGFALLSTPEALHTVRTGETIEGRILVKSVSPDGVMIEDLSSHQEQRLGLHEIGD